MPSGNVSTVLLPEIEYLHVIELAKILVRSGCEVFEEFRDEALAAGDEVSVVRPQPALSIRCPVGGRQSRDRSKAQRGTQAPLGGLD
jgi:hypothetical protein